LTDALLAQELFSLKGKTVFITGASSFMGRTMTRTMIGNGARVIAAGASGRFDRFRDQMWQEFGKDRFISYQVDFDDTEKFQTTLETIVEREPPVDVIVNNAHVLGAKTGFNRPGGRLETASLDEISANLTGGVLWPFVVVRTFGRSMIERRTGSIINIASMYGLIAPNPRLYEGTEFLNPPGYSAAKAGMIAFTRYVASFWGQYNIRCNALVPGAFPNLEERTENSVNKDDFFLERLAERTCLNRVGKPVELAGALLFLASDASAYMTGQTLVVDGGWSIT
jgi:NAD(P)-dependent dehydrogenase (short-subunit alcohol dehydrogenase family)